jgi:hypothetical protein
MQPDVNNPAIGVDGAGNLVYGPVGYASNAGHATTADSATTAVSANTATNAGHATTADSATNATNATTAGYANDYASRVIVSGADPDPAQGGELWLWVKV